MRAHLEAVLLFQVVEILSQVLADLVQGEFMQLQTKQDEEDRFNQKTMTKTATKINTNTNSNTHCSTINSTLK